MWLEINHFALLVLIVEYCVPYVILVFVLINASFLTFSTSMECRLSYHASYVFTYSSVNVFPLYLFDLGINLLVENPIHKSWFHSSATAVFAFPQGVSNLPIIIGRAPHL